MEKQQTLAQKVRLSGIALHTGIRATLNLVPADENTGIILEYLGEHSRGYTVFDGKGSTDKMNMIFIVLPRREVARTLKEIRKICNNNVFVVASEVSKFAGGYGTSK